MPARSRILQEIAAAGGWISFARYMQLALHEPGVGYYASGARKFGAGGDFVTAPELGRLFGRTLAREPSGFDRILEIGELARERAAEEAAELGRSEEHTSELQSPDQPVSRLLLVKKKKTRCDPS